jgi:hypothetical protein
VGLSLDLCYLMNPLQHIVEIVYTYMNIEVVRWTAWKQFPKTKYLQNFSNLIFRTPESNKPTLIKSTPFIATSWILIILYSSILPRLSSAISYASLTKDARSTSSSDFSSAGSIESYSARYSPPQVPPEVVARQCTLLWALVHSCSLWNTCSENLPC